MAKSRVKSGLVDAVAAMASEKLQEQIEESRGGFPSSETQAELDADEVARPLDDADFFDYCHHAFVTQGKAIIYYIKKDGSYLTTLKPPLTWDILRDKFGAGHYQVQCKSVQSGSFLKQRSEMLSELPESDDADSEDGHGGNFFGGATPPASEGKNDLALIISMMQNQSERQEAARLEQLQREEARRREDRERAEVERRERRESLKEMLTILAPLATPILANFVKPKEDSATALMLDFMKEQTRQTQEQVKDVLMEFKRVSEKPTQNPLEVMKLVQDARKEGREEMKDLLEMVEEKAEERAEELKSRDGEEDDTITKTLIKSLGPGIAAIFAQRALPQMGNEVPALPEAQAVDEALLAQQVSADGEGSQAALLQREAEREAQEKAMREQAKNNQDREKIVGIVIPKLGEAFQSMSSGAGKPDATLTARECMSILNQKGYEPKRVTRLFTREIMFQIVRSYNLPKDLDSWFNDFYAGLLVSSSSASSRPRSHVAPRAVPKTEVLLAGEGHGNDRVARGLSPRDTVDASPGAVLHARTSESLASAESSHNLTS